MTPIRVVIADDHIFYREGVKTMLGTRPVDVTVVGEAADGDEAVRQVRALHPDVVLMDLKMPGLNGIDATRRITIDQPNTAVLILTMFDDDSVFSALRAGARGYVLKDASLGDLVRSITATHAGEAIFSPSIARRITQFVTRRPGERDTAVFPHLTDREHDILRLLVAGKANDEIAVELHLTAKTVRNYVSGVLAKLHVADRGQAIAKAHQAGYNQAEDQPRR